MKTISIYLMQSLILLSIFSCGSGGKVNISERKWKFESIIAAKPIDMNNRGTLSTDLKAQSPSCIIDDIFIFYPNKSFLQDDNENKCEENSNIKGTWDMIGTDSVLLNLEDERSIRFKIKTITSKHLVLVANISLIEGGIDVTYSFNAVD